MNFFQRQPKPAQKRDKPLPPAPKKTDHSLKAIGQPLLDKFEDLKQNTNNSHVNSSWYEDNAGHIIYAHNTGAVAKSDIKKLLGTTYSKNVKGKMEFRYDGSVVCANQNDAYKYIWDTSFRLHKELLGIILPHIVVVIPCHKGDSTTANLFDYGYNMAGGTFTDVITKKSTTITATIHTHPNKLGDENPSTLVSNGYGDLGFAANKTPSKYLFVMAYTENLWGMVAIKGAEQNPNAYYSINLTQKKDYKIKLNTLFDSFDLRKYALTLSIPTGK